MQSVITPDLPRPGATLHLPPAKLLLVDDRRENLLALEAVLEPLGAEMVLAKSGTEALRHVLADDFAVILLDVQMPGMDGFETAALIKERERSRHIPIIFVTAISKEERYAFQGYNAGAVDYLTKPIDPDVLRSKVLVFVELYQKSRQVLFQQEQLREAERREAELLREEAERERERRHLAELEIREAELSQFKATLDQTLDAVLLFEAQTLQIFYINQGASALLGFPPDELHALTPLDLDAESGDRTRSVLDELRSGAEAACTYETRMRRKNGDPVPVEVVTQYVAAPGAKARFVSVVRDITERKQAQARLEKLYEREKRIADALQQSIVLAPPKDLFPGLHIETLYQPAWDDANIGGDYLDVFPLEGGRVALVVGDVSGKGLTAAARTAEVKYALRAFLRENPDPIRAFTRLNAMLCDSSRMDAPGVDDMVQAFVCIAAVVLSPETGEAVFASAGSEPPLVVRQDGEAFPVECAGMPLGISSEAVHESCTVSIGAGDALILTTDGITEARKRGEFFGFEGLTRVAQEALPHQTLDEVGRTILEAARSFAGGRLQDDACLLLAARH